MKESKDLFWFLVKLFDSRYWRFYNFPFVLPCLWVHTFLQIPALLADHYSSKLMIFIFFFSFQLLPVRLVKPVFSKAGYCFPLHRSWPVFQTDKEKRRWSYLRGCRTLSKSRRWCLERCGAIDLWWKVQYCCGLESINLY